MNVFIVYRHETHGSSPPDIDAPEAAFSFETLAKRYCDEEKHRKLVVLELEVDAEVT